MLYDRDPLPQHIHSFGHSDKTTDFPHFSKIKFLKSKTFIFFSCSFLTSIMVLCLNLTTFVTNWSDCYCWNVSWRLFLSEEMTVSFPMQIKLVFTDLPWVCIFIQLWSSNTAWWVPDRSPDTKGLHAHHFCTEHGSNLDTMAKISYYLLLIFLSFLY